MENIVLIVLFTALVTLTQTNANSSSKRHVIYWDSSMTKILKNSSKSIPVEIGNFMDILCPQTNIGITQERTDPVTFDLYNVTEDGFRTCDPAGGRLIFACNLPDQENKLTIKFQTISPSPFGFRFQRCAEYFFLAVPRSHRLDGKSRGCNKDSERLRIHVGCNKEKHHHVEPTKTTTTTTTEKPRTSFIDRIRNEKNKQNIFVPDIVAVTSKQPVAEKVAVVPTTNDDGNSASVAQLNTITTLVFATSTLLWYSYLSHST